MNTAELRTKLHEYIDTADDRHLQAIYVLLEKDVDSGYVYDEETLQELKERYEAYQRGEGKSYTVEESLEMILKHKRQ